MSKYLIQCIQLYNTTNKLVLKNDVIFMNKSSTIRISIETKKRLNELGNLNDSYNSVISKLLDEHDEKKKKIKTWNKRVIIWKHLKQ